MIREYDYFGVYVIMEDQDDYDAVNNGDLTEPGVTVVCTAAENWKCTECREEFKIGQKIYVTIIPERVGGEKVTGSHCKSCVETKAVKEAL